MDGRVQDERITAGRSVERPEFAIGMPQISRVVLHTQVIALCKGKLEWKDLAWDYPRYEQLDLTMPFLSQFKLSMIPY